MKRFLTLCLSLLSVAAFATDNKIPLPATGGNTGPNMGTVTVTNGNGDTVNQGIVSVGDPASNNRAAVSASGALKVDASATTQPVSIATMPSTPVTGTFWQATQPVSGTVTANINSADGTATGSITNGQNVAIPMAGYYSSTAEITGAYTGATFVPEVMSGSTWVATQFYNPSIQAYAATVSANGTYVIANVGGMAQVRVRCSAMSTGSATVNLRATTAQANSLVSLGAATTANSQPVNIASDQTVPVSLASVPSHAVTVTSGSVTAVQGTGSNLHVQVDTAPTTTVTGTVTATSAGLPASLGAKTTANSTAVNIASDQTVNVQMGTAAEIAAGTFALTTPRGEQKVVEEPSQLFFDSFDAALDTTNRWAAPTLSGTGAALAVSAGGVVITLPTTAGYAYTTSIPSFQDPTPGQLRFGVNIKLEATPYVSTTYRFWGFGTPQATPSTAGCPACSNTITDGIGIETYGDAMYFAEYTGGVRTQIADLSASRPTDGLTHNYQIFYRQVEAAVYINGTDVPVAVATAVQTGALAKDSFPVTYLGVQGGTAACNFSSATVSVSDTARNNSTLSDPLMPFRRATIGASNIAAPAYGLSVVPAISASAVTATTAGRAVYPTVDSTNGGLNVRLMDSATYLSPQVAAGNALAASSALATMPAIGRSAVSAVTAGRSANLAVDATTGFQLVNLSDGASYLKASVLANDTTASANGLETLPAIARAAPTAVTAARGEKIQVDVPTGAVYVAEAATTSATGLSSVQIAVNTASAVKASAGNVYGFSVANASASVCYLQFYNSNAPTCGTSVISSFALPVTPGVLNITSNIPLGNYSAGIGTCVSTTPTGGTTCGSVIGGLTVLYK